MATKKSFKNLSFSWARSTEKGNLDVCIFQPDAFSANSSGVPVYLRSDAVRNAIMVQTGQEPTKGSVFTVEGEYVLVDLSWTDEAGNLVTATTKDGVVLQTIQRVG